MSEAHRQAGDRFLLRFGAVAAILGTILQVAAGTSQSVSLGAGTELALTALADQPAWLWPTAYLGFIFGALLWVSAVVALASTLPAGVAWALGRLAVATVIAGATLHIVDGALNAGALTSLAGAWAAAPADERAALAQNADVLLHILDATWAGVITLFHGVPFVLAGLAVAVSRRYPAWLGWVGVFGGVGSLLIGFGMFYGLAEPGLAVPFAVVLSFFMVVLGGLMWIQTGNDVDTPALQ